MISPQPKKLRLQLDPEAYRQLRLKVLQRDRWHCQACGATTNLQVHHVEARSHQGSDSEGNLMTLCSECHRKIHLRITSEGWEV